MYVRTAGLLLFFGLAGCGEPPAGGASFGISIPWAAPQTCTNQNALLDMEPVVRIGGHDDCSLLVNTDLTVEGSCDDITIGLIRPLVLVYGMRDPNALTEPPTPLAYDIGWVDLRKDALDGDAVVTVEMGKDDGVNSTFLYTQAELDALPGDAAIPATNLEYAEQWAKKEIAKRGETLDRDCDTEANLTEVCEGGATYLFEDDCP